jgi:hypothetical protein
MQCVTNLASICGTCSAIVRNFSYVYTRLYSIMVKTAPILFVCCFARAEKLTRRSNVILETLRSVSCSRNVHPFTEPEVYCGVNRTPQWAPYFPKQVSSHLITLTLSYHPFTFVNLQLDAQNSYLFTYNTYIKILLCFDHYPVHLQEAYVVTVYVQPLVSSLAGDCLVHRLRKVILRCIVNQPSRCPIYVLPSGSLPPNSTTKMLRTLSPTFMLCVPSVLFSLF